MPASFRQAVLDRCLLKQFEAGKRSTRSAMSQAACSASLPEDSGVSIAPRGRGPYAAHFAMPGSWFGEVRPLPDSLDRVD